MSKIKKVNGFKDSGFSHFFEWDTMGFDIDIYNKFPRGRIVYDVYDKNLLFIQQNRLFKIKISTNDFDFKYEIIS